MRMLRRLTLLALVLSAPAPPLRAQLESGDARERLALGYLRLELALRERSVADTLARAALNRAFDRATLRFFAGDQRGTLVVLDSIIASLGGGPAGGGGDARAMLAALDGERRVAALGGGSVPYLLHVPPGDAPDDGWPVVVALHGVGGDERMFFGGYGAGAIRPLATAEGVAVLAPRAPLSPAALLALVDALAGEHHLDASRIGLIGKSMGGGVAARVAAEEPSRVRGVVCIAAACDPGAAAAAVPLRLHAGGLDPIAPAARIAAVAGRLGEAGAMVEYHPHPHEGHTLVVGEALPGALAWLAALLRR
jgi:phospholipase/carboxylesterase